MTTSELECPRCSSRGYVCRTEAEPGHVFAVVRWARDGVAWFDRPHLTDMTDRYGCGRCPPERRSA